METIKIVKIGRKQMPSKFKEGTTYSLTQVIDDKGKKYTGFGKWTEGWAAGSEIQADIKEKKWTNKDGFEEVSLTLENPNKQPFNAGGRGGFGRSTTNPVAEAYNSAAMFAIAAALSSKGEKKITLESLDKIANHILEKSKGSSDSAPVDSTPTVRLDSNVKPATTTDDIFAEDNKSANEVIADDEEPF